MSGGFSVNRKKPIFLKNRFDRFVFRQKTGKPRNRKNPEKSGNCLEIAETAREVLSADHRVHIDHRVADHTLEKFNIFLIFSMNL